MPDICEHYFKIQNSEIQNRKDWNWGDT